MENNMLVNEPVSDSYKLLLVSEAGTDDIAMLSAAMRLHNRKAEILRTVDMLGVALADHGHQWTPEERAGYEAATRILRNPNADLSNTHVTNSPEKLKNEESS